MLSGAVFPAVPFNATVYPASSTATSANAEIVRVTNIATNTLTITRTQETSSARTILVGDRISATITAKTFTDIEAATPPFSTGTWTPVLGGATSESGQVYVDQVGTYTKVGDIVIAPLRITLNTKGTITGAVLIKGLPFTVANGGGSGVGGSCAIGWLMSTTWINIQAYPSALTTTAALAGNTVAAVSNLSTVNPADVANNSVIFGTLVYKAV